MGLRGFLIAGWAGLLAAGVCAEVDKAKLIGGGGGRGLLAPIGLGSAYVEVAVADNGNFTMATRLGDPGNPADDYKHMLYGHPNPGTGATTLRVDGVDSWNYLSFQIGPTISGPTTANGVNTTIWQAGGVRLTQRLRLARGFSTGLEDTLLIEYEMANVDAVAHAAGVRLFLDTWLGAVDGAPFRVPGLGEVVRERELLGAAIPEYWQGFDVLAAPTMQSQGTLAGGWAVAPNRIVWGWWSTMKVNRWDYTVDPARDLLRDSALALYWEPVALQPGETHRVATYYGLSGVDLDLNPPLAVGLTAPRRLDVIDDRYSPNPFTVTAYLSNTLTGAAPRSGVWSEIALPTGLTLAAGETARHELGTLAVGQEVQTSWQVEAAPHAAETQLQYWVRAGATGVGRKDVPRSITLPALDLNQPPRRPDGHPLLAFRITAPSVDPEGTTVTYTYRWTSDGGDVVTHGPTTELIDVLTEWALVDEGETWTVTATPNDGERDGEPAVGRVRIADLQTGTMIWTLLP